MPNSSRLFERNELNDKDSRSSHSFQQNLRRQFTKLISISFGWIKRCNNSEWMHTGFAWMHTNWMQWDSAAVWWGILDWLLFMEVLFLEFRAIFLYFVLLTGDFFHYFSFFPPFYDFFLNFVASFQFFRFWPFFSFLTVFFVLVSIFSFCLFSIFAHFCPFFSFFCFFRAFWLHIPLFSSEFIHLMLNLGFFSNVFNLISVKIFDFYLF